MSRRRRILLGAGVLLLVSAGAWAVRSPLVAALTKSTRDFEPVLGAPRVRYEAGAEDMATRVAAFLDSAIATVEAGQGRPFLEPFTVYVCASQRSLNEFLGIPLRMPIRGTVRFGAVFIAPSAFDWQGEDVHREAMMHELSHLHLRQHLGFVAHRGRIPPWFNEALADVVSGAGGESVSRAEAVDAILNGPSLRPDSTGNLWSLRSAGNYGLPGPMLHKQGTMFLEYMRARNPEDFEAFILDVLEERSFAGPLRSHFGESVDELWEAFATTLRAEPSEEADPLRAGPG